MTKSRVLIALTLIFFGIFAHAIVVIFNVVDTNWDFDAHFAWASQFSDAFRAGNPYPRWMPLGNHGLGEPVTLYYSPLFYYLVSILDWSPLTVWGSMKWVSVFTTVLSGWCAWLIMRPLAGTGWALLAAIAVQTAPMIFMVFHYFNGYPWGASFAAYSLFLLCSLNYFVYGKRSYLPLVSVAALILVITHIVSSIMVFLCMGVSVLIILGLKSGRDWIDDLPPVFWWGMSAFLGIGMAWFYLWPALTSLDLVQSSNWQDRYPPQDAFAFPTITAYLFGMRWFSLQWVVPAVILSSVILSTFAYRAWGNELTPEHREAVRFLVVLGWVSLFFASELSYLFWLEPSPLLWIQSPHRFTYVSCLPALLANVFWLDRLWRMNANALWKLAYLGPIFASLTLFALLTLKLLNLGVTQESLDSQPLQPYGSYHEYETAVQTREAKSWVERGGFAQECRSIEASCVDSGDYNWRIVSSSPQRRFRLPLLAFPGWEVKINGEVVETRIDKETGLLEVSIGSGTSYVQASWRRLPQERQGFWISLLFLALFFSSAFWIWIEPGRYRV